MNFYRIKAKAGHQGTGKYIDIPVYVSARSINEAIDSIKHMPMIKKSKSLPATNLKIIQEDEFVVGTITNQYKKYLNYDINEIFNPLEQISNRLRFVLKEYEFTTNEGKTLRDFCNNYNSATDEEKEKVENEYKNWALALIKDAVIPDDTFGL